MSNIHSKTFSKTNSFRMHSGIVHPWLLLESCLQAWHRCTFEMCIQRLLAWCDTKWVELMAIHWWGWGEIKYLFMQDRKPVCFRTAARREQYSLRPRAHTHQVATGGNWPTGNERDTVRWGKKEENRKQQDGTVDHCWLIQKEQKWLRLWAADSHQVISIKNEEQWKVTKPCKQTHDCSNGPQHQTKWNDWYRSAKEAKRPSYSSRNTSYN